MSRGGLRDILTQHEECWVGNGGFVSSTPVNLLLNWGGEQPRELERSLEGADARAWYRTWHFA